jgi:hypothetical protein
MQKRINIEGSPMSQFHQLVKAHGHNKDTIIEVGTVLTPYPNLTIRLDSDGIELDMDDLVVASRVIEKPLVANDRVIILGDDPAQTYYVIDKAVE